VGEECDMSECSAVTPTFLPPTTAWSFDKEHKTRDGFHGKASEPTESKKRGHDPSGLWSQRITRPPLFHSCGGVGGVSPREYRRHHTNITLYHVRSPKNSKKKKKSASKRNAWEKRAHCVVGICVRTSKAQRVMRGSEHKPDDSFVGAAETG
jgi:hypothetical protein